MNDWKHIPAISTNAFVVANLANKTMRIVFGERLSKLDDGSFHSAVQINREGAEVLIDLLRRALGQSGGGGGEGGGGEGGGGGMSVIMGSTTVH
jgi:hypothetical protein